MLKDTLFLQNSSLIIQKNVLSRFYDIRIYLKINSWYTKLYFHFIQVSYIFPFVSGMCYLELELQDSAPGNVLSKVSPFSDFVRPLKHRCNSIRIGKPISDQSVEILQFSCHSDFM